MDENKILAMEQEIKNLNQAIVDLNRKLKESEAMKSNFISNVMNEIYNPFSSILSLAQNIIALEKDEMPEAISLAETIYDEATTLDFDLKNIFSAARIEGGLEVPQPKRISCTSIINEVVDTCQLQAVKKQVELIVNGQSEGATSTFVTDPDFLKQCLINVLHNAIKFSPVSSSVEIEFSISEDKLIIEVKDQGPGINSTDKERIFDRFKKLDVTINSINSGYGLGLSVAQALVDLLDGRIDSRENARQGTIVSIEIPQAKSNEDATNLDDDEFLHFDEEIF
ncbi:MAG: HAMP domain-containing histidine kinase [Bacteroidales bacterium]|nr:HAMP domain-containing histidine kinase [Bacteroidales bacterium]MCF8457882.1 HAMP domain-containing histidine kinase [Bacteroidales bacterium]